MQIRWAGPRLNYVRPPASDTAIPLETANQLHVHGARLNPGNGGEGKGPGISQDDNTDTHVNPEPQITTASVLVR
jgi:hypothetical protein